MTDKSKPNRTSVIDKRAIGVNAFCDAVSIGRTSAYEAINEGEVVSFKYRKRRLITVESIDAFIERQLQRSAR